MEKLTNSVKSLYQECPRKFFIKHERGFVPVREASYLAFGTVIHSAIEQFYNGVEFKDIDFGKEIENEFEMVKIHELIRGYINHWGRFEEVIATEKEFKFPLLNPKTKSASRTFEMAGKIDGVVKQNGIVSVIEHKTTADNIEDPSCDYWLKLSLDPQISGYFVGAETLGFEPTNIIYDVIKKPTIKPFKETPDDKKKYKKDGTLYANLHDADETPKAYRERLRSDIAENPNKYFQRKDIPRIADDLIEFLSDSWSVAKLIMESRNNDFFPRRISQCFNYSKCPYVGVCSKLESLDDVALFKQVGKNPELNSTKGESNEF